jgi:hypothetical protein
MDDLNFDFGKILLLGVCTDFYQSFIEKGAKTIDAVKNALIQKICKKQDCLVYMSLPENKLPTTTGMSTHQIKTFKEPFSYNISNIFRQCVDVVGGVDGDYEKHILLITNKADEKSISKYKSGMKQNSNKEYGCNIHVFGIGTVEKYNLLEKLAEESEAVFLNILNAEQINEQIKIIGEKNV